MINTSLNLLKSWSSRPIWECDIIYRWINPTDGQIIHKNAPKTQLYYKSGNNVQRYRDNNELLYSLRSLKNIKGILNVHIIAKGSPPKWLNLNKDNIFWWDEDILVNKLANLYNIKNINIKSSEISKYCILFMKNLNERFIFMDDDYMIMPRVGEELTTALFFNENGIPIHPLKIKFSHRPMPFLKKSYMNELVNIGKNDMKLLLTAGYQRFKIDPFIYMSLNMANNGTVISINIPTIGTHHPMETHLKNIIKYHKYATYLHESKNVVYDFFKTIMRIKPYCICINDDWPWDKEGYQYNMTIVHKFLNITFPDKSIWEK
jgi:hypothetical protein